MGACTIANRTVGVSIGGMRTVECDLTPSASYATGGDTVAGLGLVEVLGVSMVGKAKDSRGIAITPRGYQVVMGTTGAPASATVKVYNGSAAEVTNATNLSTLGAVRVVFTGYA